MRMFMMRLFAMSGILILPLLVTGCYRQVDEQSLSTAVSQAMPTDTATPTPTPSVTPSPTPRPTRDAASGEGEEDAKQTTEDLLVAQAAQATASPFVVEMTEEAGPPADIDPFALTATVIVAQITQTVEFQATQTAIALGIGATPTVTPTFTPEPGVTFTAVPGVPGSACVHEIRVGDNLFRLSLRYGVTINELALANGIINPNIVLVGQLITIPGCGTTGALSPVTTAPIQNAGGVGITPAAAAQAVPSGRVHVVQQGETLFEISLQYGTTVNALANANGIVNINNILIGTELMIP